MFGYVLADGARLDEAQRLRYQCCYCGLCHTLRMECSSLSRLALNYDMVFLVLLLTSLYEPEEEVEYCRCIVHPFKKQPHFTNEWSRYGAAMSVILSYGKCMDDWFDDHNPLRLLESRVFRGPSRRAAKAFPRQSKAVGKGIKKLSDLEKRNIRDPDRAANTFARLLGEIFVPVPDDLWAADLRKIGEGLGRFIYLVDAAVDLEADIRKKRYNPLTSLSLTGILTSDFQRDLEAVLGEATTAFERLPIVQDAALLRNILYSGVWMHYRRAVEKKNKKPGEEGETG